MIKFEIEKVLFLHKMVVESSGVTIGVRDYNLLDSAIQSPFQTFCGMDVYLSVVEKAARLGYNLISNHAFIDGNKRIGILVMMTYLRCNGVVLNFTDEELVEIGFSIASGKMKYQNLVDVLSHKNVKKDNKPSLNF